jgi:hypothetical protein
MASIPAFKSRILSGLKPPNGCDRKVPSVTNLGPAQLPCKSAEDLEIVPFYKEYASRLGQLSENSVYVRPQYPKNAFELTWILYPTGESIFFVHQNDIICFGFCDYLRRMRSEQNIRPKITQQSQELALKLGMQIYIWFIDQEDRYVG